jgi:hypothetical protein
MRETSIEDFLDDSGDGPRDPDESGTESHADAAGERKEPDEHDDTAEDTAAPARPTYRWTPEAAVCPDCGTSVQQRWWDDGTFVCADCKTW